MPLPQDFTNVPDPSFAVPHTKDMNKLHHRKPTIAPPYSMVSSRLPQISETLEENTANEVCCSCGAPVVPMCSVAVHGRIYHRSCAVCYICCKSLDPAHGQLFPGISNQILCKECMVSRPDLVKSEELCMYCKKILGTETMMALGYRWHPECFVCMHCNIVLTNFYRDVCGVPYCESCWLRHFAKVCMMCQTPICEQVLTIESNSYHVGCVSCAVCRKTFDNVLDILTLDSEFWHVDCFNEGDSDTGSTKSAHSIEMQRISSEMSNSQHDSPVLNAANTLTEPGRGREHPNVDNIAKNAPLSAVHFDDRRTVENDHISNPKRSQCCAIS